jgi:hypothetical protein
MDVPRMLVMKPRNGKPLLTLRSEFLAGGKIGFKLTENEPGALTHLTRVFENLARAHACQDSLAIDSLMSKLSDKGVWLYENGSYRPYRIIGIPALMDGYLHFLPWSFNVRSAPRHDFAEFEGNHREGLEYPEDEPDQWTSVGEALCEGLEKANLAASQLP